MPIMWARFSSTIVVLACATTTSHAQQVLRIARAEVMSLDMKTEPVAIGNHAATQGATGVVWEHVVPDRAPVSEASGQPRLLEDIRLLVRFDSPLPSGHVLRFFDSNGAEVDSLRPGAGATATEFWSKNLPGARPRVSLTREQQGATPAATIFFAYKVLPAEKQSISPPNQLMPASDAPPRLRQLGKPVARLRFMILNEGEATCTTFVVGDRLLLTNQHCISNDEERASALVDFNYDSEDSPLTALRVSAIVSKSRELDYALLRLATEPPPNTGRLYFAPSQWQWNAAPNPHPLAIVQHPSGLPKAVSIAECVLDGPSRVGVTPGDNTDFGHQCDTLGGSSGSPVMDWKSGLVVGLHHFGFVSGVNHPVNQAVLFTRILEQIRKDDAQAHADMIRPRP
jgi:hypothetical protein